MLTDVVVHAGLSVLLLTGVLKWKDCLQYPPAWDTLFWFAVLVGMSGTSLLLPNSGFDTPAVPLRSKNIQRGSRPPLLPESGFDTPAMPLCSKHIQDNSGPVAYCISWDLYSNTQRKLLELHWEIPPY